MRFFKVRDAIKLEQALNNVWFGDFRVWARVAKFNRKGTEDVWSTSSGENVVMIHGRFVQCNEEFYLFNVYAPCDNGARQLLWDRLSVMLQQLAGKNVCICGDFNAV